MAYHLATPRTALPILDWGGPRMPTAPEQFALFSADVICLATAPRSYVGAKVIPQHRPARSALAPAAPLESQGGSSIELAAQSGC